MFSKGILHLTSILLAAFTMSGACNNNQVPFSTSTEKYEAPLRYCDDAPGDIVSGSYLVELRPDHSFDQHCVAVGTDVRPYLRKILSAFQDRVVYTCENVNDELMNTIRADRGVQLVQCDWSPGATLEAVAGATEVETKLPNRSHDSSH